MQITSYCIISKVPFSIPHIVPAASQFWIIDVNFTFDSLKYVMMNPKFYLSDFHQSVAKYCNWQVTLLRVYWIMVYAHFWYIGEQKGGIMLII